METLKKVYTKVTLRVITKETQLIESEEIKRWIPVLLCWAPDQYMGISEDGYWVIEEQAGLRVLNNSASLLRIKILLERPLEEIRKELIVYFNSYNIIENVDTIFPFLQIIQEVLEDGFEYWMELAFKWFEVLPLEEKTALKDTLFKIVNNKQINQKLRHKAKKEFRYIEYADMDGTEK